MKPLPAVICSWKLDEVASDRYEPASPQMSPARNRARYRIRRTLMPTVPAAAGFSPDARKRRPQRVR